MWEVGNGKLEEVRSGNSNQDRREMKSAGPISSFNHS